MHGTYAANMAIYECDLLINFGARFDDRLTGNLKHFAPNAKVAHIDIDPAEIGKNVPTNIPIVSDTKEALNELIEQTKQSPDLMAGKADQNKEEYPLWYKHDPNGMSPQWVIEAIHKVTKGEAIVATDVGQHQMWAAQYYTFKEPHRWITSADLEQWALASLLQLVHKLLHQIVPLLRLLEMAVFK